MQAAAWAPPADAESQVLQIARWFTVWTEVERRIFWSQMLERVSPAAELASAFGSIGLGGAWNTLAHQAAIPQPAGLAAQASWVWTWFDSFPERAKNQLVNTLEEIGPASTYEFYKCFSAARKEQTEQPPWEVPRGRGYPHHASAGSSAGGGMEF
eukprot:gene20513-25482_t